jgi:cell division septation protein DedD
MTRTDGEHELVLGNKQLLSAFFVVVILLGVFFTMGYFVGKNTATAGFNAGQGVTGGGTRPDAAGRPIDTQAVTGSLPPDSTSPATDPSFPTTPQPSTTTPAPTRPTPPREAKSETRSAAKSDAKSDFPLDSPPAKTESMATPKSEELYLQVSAIRRPDADNMVKVLREHGFPALLGESSKQGLYRVMVGPFKTNGEMGRAKTELKAKGFESIVAK